MTKVINYLKNKFTFVILIEVFGGGANPNGDPDLDGRPRRLNGTNRGYITQESIKYKIRRWWEIAYKYVNYTADGVTLENNDKKALDALGIDINDLAKIKKENPDISKTIADKLREIFYDIKFFGGIFTTFSKENLPCSKAKGTVIMGDAVSVDDVFPQYETITRCAITTNEDAKNKETEMGEKQKINYGLYRLNGTIYASRAEENGFTEDDVKAFLEGALNMYEESGSAACHDIRVREIIVFKHAKATSVVRECKLYDMVKITKKEGVEIPLGPDDYDVTVPEEMPEGITCKRLDPQYAGSNFKCLQ